MHDCNIQGIPVCLVRRDYVDKFENRYGNIRSETAMVPGIES